MGAKISNDISSESTHQTHDHSPKIMRTPKKDLYQKCSKKCEISNFDFFPRFFSCLTWWSMWKCKTCKSVKYLENCWSKSKTDENVGLRG